ncbi:iron-sulfur cluster assembly accessory protein [Oscillatoria sp. CS-180]|uniref:HesB/IscA family protein n=1 Tax=Oscillatoria sp. CS-180 TaxID=3021720 RepID=UPI002330BA37|nr:iron-sulfur cluster assembly accessory protein [Oscillatoria sp. CS-180]MDB9526448.1 iron-sulfur cluster assembly accessory protein [Oscillatoria sp. CS-180]
MIQLSQSVIRELKRLEAKDPYGSGVVRLAIAPGGCSGLVYDWQFRQAAKPTDQVLKIDQLKVVISEDHLAQCEGLAIDYSEDLMGGNFRFTNPLAKQVCGCGASFSLEETPIEQTDDCSHITSG